MKDLEIMEMFLLEPRGKCRLQAEVLTAQNNAASRCRLGSCEAASTFMKRTRLLPPEVKGPGALQS